jgi:hypothetical protein
MIFARRQGPSQRVTIVRTEQFAGKVAALLP